jgi:putative transposase
MRKLRFTEEQIVGILQEYAAGAMVSELYGIVAERRLEA